MSLTEREKKLVATLLGIAADKFSNHVCNDFDLGEHLTPNEIDDIVRKYHEWNGDPEEYEQMRAEGRSLRHAMPDWCLMNYFAMRLTGEIG